MLLYIPVHTAALVALGVISVDMSHSIDWDAVLVRVTFEVRAQSQPSEDPTKGLTG